MVQFDVCLNANKGTQARVPYLLVLQTDFLEPLATVVVSPLVRTGDFAPAKRLNPVFEIDGEQFILSTAELAGVPKASLGRVVWNLSHERDAVIAAIDLLFTGF